MTKITSGHYLKVENRNPDFIQAVEELGKAARQAGPLDERLAQLLQLAAAAAVRSEGAVHSHTRRALEAGATAGEIRHALILLTSTIGFPNVMAALSWSDDMLDRQKAG